MLADYVYHIVDLGSTEILQSPVEVNSAADLSRKLFDSFREAMWVQWVADDPNDRRSNELKWN